MPEHQRPYTNSTVGVQRAGDGHVVVTLYATEEQVADLAWQLSRIVHSPTYPKGTVQGQYREFYKDTIEGLAKENGLVRRTLEDGKYPGTAATALSAPTLLLRDRDFEFWLERHYKTDAGRPLDRRSIGSRVSNCRHIAEYEGSLDDHFEHDELQGLLQKFEYGRKDEKRGAKPRHAVPIDGDLTSGTATLKSAIVLYAKFSRAWPKGASAPGV